MRASLAGEVMRLIRKGLQRDRPRNVDEIPFQPNAGAMATFHVKQIEMRPAVPFVGAGVLPPWMLGASGFDAAKFGVRHSRMPPSFGILAGLNCGEERLVTVRDNPQDDSGYSNHE